MSDLTENLRKIRKACNLGALVGQSLDEYWVDTQKARNPLYSVRNNLQELLMDSDTSKILFYGHGGSGKSTELNRLISQLGDSYLVISFSVLDEMSLMDVNSEDIILVLMERLIARAHEAGLTLKNTHAMQGIYDYFATITDTKKDLHKESAEITAGVGISAPNFMLGLIKLFADFKAEVLYEARNETTKIAAIRKRPGDLIKYANLLVNEVRNSLAEGQRLLFVVEDLDKLDISTARQVFIEKPKILTGINANIVYTIPIFTFHSPDAQILRDQFINGTLTLPMIKVIGLDRARTVGFEAVREIIVKRLGNDALSEAALDLVIEKTGGVLQHAFEVIANATLLSDVQIPMQQEHIRHGLNYKKNGFIREITLPFEKIPGLDNHEQLYDRLAQCFIDQLNGTPCKPGGLAIDQVLLKSCALVEYNGEGWLGVHPLVQEILIETKGFNLSDHVRHG